MGYQQGLQAGADDIFEAELYNLLDIAANKATNNSNNYTHGAQLVGNLPVNISQEFMKELQEQGNSIVNRVTKKSDLIDMPTFRSGKTDVTGYNSSFSIEANIQPQW